MPTQISAGEVFANGQQVDGTRLNDHVNKAVILKGAIKEQDQIESPVLASDDKFLVIDTSADTLRKVNASSIVQSNLPIISSLVTSSVLTAQPNEDIVLIANDGIAVTGKAFTSVTGLDVTITSTAHGLSAGQVISVTASVASYTGKFKITSVTVDTIVYTLASAATPASGTCGYIKEGTVHCNDQSIIGNSYISGNQEIIGNQRIDGNAVFNGDVNVTGTLKVNGSTIYSLYEVFEESPSQFTNTSAGAWVLSWTSTAFTKPADEIWIVELDTTVSCYGREDLSETKIDSSVTGTVRGYDSIWSNHFGGSGLQYKHILFKYIINAGIAVTADTVRQYVKSAVYFTSTIANSASYPKTFRIYKYKTA